MGFSLELFFEDLFEILEREQKAAKTVSQLRRRIEHGYTYAKDCGQIKQTEGGDDE